jgi:acetoacetyl-CoA synthetase
MSSNASRLWEPGPERIARTNLTAFTRVLAERSGRAFPDYRTLQQFSIRNIEAFWPAVWDFCGVMGDPGSVVLTSPADMSSARFYPDARLSFVANVLRRQDAAPAIVSTTEHGRDRTVTFAELQRQVRQVAAALRAEGVQTGDRVAGVMANVPEAIVAALGAAAIGAVWSSCSPDFGVQGVLDRFGQIGPVVLVAVDGYVHGGRSFPCLPKIAELAARLPTVRRTVVVPLLEERPALASASFVSWPDWVSARDADDTPLEQFAFNHPLYVLYSSGTTGAPKCIVHGAGGTLLQHLKEHQLHCDIRPDDRVFYFTTCGWMMWNWLVTALASEATIVLYDGSPFHPDGNRLFDLADRLRFTLFGTSAKFIDAVNKAGFKPRETHALDSVRTMTSTGSPLSPESFDFVYEHIKRDLHLASISGGTDIVGCFVGGNPNGPVYRGEIQAVLTGMDVDVFDEQGRPLGEGAGELVCKSPFPSMPLGFWHDADGSAYRAAYFEKYPGVWSHGDWIRFTAHGGAIIYGRSDATLNPGGVRIGTAEIYRQVERLPEVVESLAVGQQWEGDERIVLFVRLRGGLSLDDALRARIIERIRTNVSPRHVPARIVQVADIPRTKSGKIVELAVRHVIHGRPVTNREALANPEALDLFRDLPGLQS